MVDNCLHLWKPNGHELGELINLEKRYYKESCEELDMEN